MTSFAAGFCYAILLALRLHLFPASKIDRYRAMSMRALDAVIDHIDDVGQLQNVSFGTAIGFSLHHYR